MLKTSLVESLFSRPRMLETFLVGVKQARPPVPLVAESLAQPVST
jgi:hypothetical protein